MMKIDKDKLKKEILDIFEECEDMYENYALNEYEAVDKILE